MQHNSHLGDASATDMGQRRGEVNVGQLLRERYGRDKVGAPQPNSKSIYSL